MIQLEGLYLLPYISTIRENSKALISFRAHNLEHEIWEQNAEYEKNVLKKFYLNNLALRIKKFELSFLNKYDVLIPITERDASKFEKFGNKKPVFVCPTGINLKKFENTEIDVNNLNFYHFGSLDWLPNTEGLIWFLENIWKKIQEKYPNIQFSIAGRNASTKFVRKLKDYKINYFGEVENSEDFTCFQTIMVVPLQSGSGMRIKIIEAMAAGKIVISTSKGLEGIDAQDNKEVLIANTEIEFIRTIILIIENKIDIKLISVNAKNYISKKFNNIALSKLLLNFYSNPEK